MADAIAQRWEMQNEAGRRFFSRGDFTRAEQAFTAAIREAEQLGAGDLRLATSLSNLAQLKYKQSAHVEAEQLFRRSLTIREQALGADHPGVLQSINNLAAVCYAREALDDAEPLFRRTLEITERNLGPHHPDLIPSLNNLSRICFKRNDYGAATPYLLRLLTIKERTFGADHPEVAPVLNTLVKLRCAEGTYAEAEQLCRRVLTIREREQPVAEHAIAASLDNLADVCALQGKKDDELALRRRAAMLRGQPADSVVSTPANARPAIRAATRAGVADLAAGVDRASLLDPTRSSYPSSIADAGLIDLSPVQVESTPPEPVRPLVSRAALPEPRSRSVGPHREEYAHSAPSGDFPRRGRTRRRSQSSAGVRPRKRGSRARKVAVILATLAMVGVATAMFARSNMSAGHGNVISLNARPVERFPAPPPSDGAAGISPAPLDRDATPAVNGAEIARRPLADSPPLRDDSVALTTRSDSAESSHVSTIPSEITRPRVDVDLDRAIDGIARARADSVANTVNVTPPAFNTKAPKLRSP